MQKLTVILITIILGIYISLSPIIYFENQNMGYSIIMSPIYFEEVQSSQVSEKIHINGNNEWNDFKFSGNCTGSGKFSDPYIIKDITIDAKNFESCILIENSDVYFTIQNCSLFNSDPTEWHTAGIYLRNVTNAKILDNNCSFNRHGIFTYFSKNNTISGNIANNNSIFGICLAAQSNDTMISGNTACFNSQVGIMIDGGYTSHYAYNNLIVNNNASYNTDAGMRIEFTNDSKIINNTAMYNGVFPSGGCALNIQLCQNISISSNRLGGSNSYGVYAYNLKLINIFNNTISSNDDSGVFLDCVDKGSREINVTNNDFTNNRNGIDLNGYFYGEEFQGVEKCIILENKFIDCFQGAIMIDDIFDLTVIKNEMTNCGIMISGQDFLASSHLIDTTNLVNGKPVYYYSNQSFLEPSDFLNAGQIILVNCNQSLLSNNHISSSSSGISLLYSNDNIISNCDLNYNPYGLMLSISYNNTISEITSNHNSIGIQFYQCNSNTITNSYINYNDFGILLYFSNNNQITKNIVNNNFHGLFLLSSNYNQIKQNTINSNNIGIYLYGYEFIGGSNHNSIIKNTLIGNNQCFYINENCEGNVFENNYCVDEYHYEYLISGYNMLFFIGSSFLILLLLLKLLLILSIYIQKHKKLLK